MKEVKYELDSNPNGFLIRGEPAPSLLPPDATVDLSITAQKRHIVKDVIVHPESRASFEIYRVRVGNEAIIDLGTGIDAELFDGSCLREFLREVKCDIGMDVTIVAKNVSGAPARFRATAIGEELPPLKYRKTRNGKRRAYGLSQNQFARLQDFVIDPGETRTFSLFPQLCHMPKRLVASKRVQESFEIVSMKVGDAHLIATKDLPMKLAVGPAAVLNEVVADAGHIVSLEAKNITNAPQRFSALVLADEYEVVLESETK